MPQIIDLRVNKNLLNSNFEKYQFSSENVSIAEEKSLSQDVFRIEPSLGQDSWLEARLFAFHNHLFINTYDSSCWFYDENFHVWQLQIDGTLNFVHSCNDNRSEKNDYSNQIMNSEEQEQVNECIKQHTFNPTITFASEKIVTLTRSNNSLHVIMYENPSSNATPNSEVSVFLINNIEPGILCDSRYIKDKSLLIIAMCCIVVGDKGKKQSKLILLFYSIPNTAETSSTTHNKELELIKKQELIINGSIEYVYIESDGNFINYLGQDTAKFTFDSSKPQIVNKQDDDVNEAQAQLKIPKYSWSQDEDSLTVWVKLSPKYVEKLIKPKIKILATSLEVAIGDDSGEILIDGKLQFRIDHDTAVWSIENNDTLKIELMKHEQGQIWNELIVNDKNGEYLPNEDLAGEIHSRLSHLCTNQQETSSEQPAIGFNSEQLEECDFVESGNNTLQRIDLTNHSTTHLVMFGTHNRILFHYKLKSCQVFCSRHDHDGCVWKSVEIDDDRHKNWNLIHTDTLPGFGYVEASKSNKKFCISPPNFHYVAIIEHTRYGFLYERPSDTNVKVAKQRIIDLGSDCQPIMGAVATNEYIILLTKNKLYRLKTLF